MPRVKRSVHARKKRRKVLEQAKGYWGLKSVSYKRAKEQVEKSLTYAYRDRKVQEADVPLALDHAHQRRGTRERPLVQPVHRGLQGGGDRARPQGSGRPRRLRSRRLREDRRAREERARGGRREELITSASNERLKLVRKLHDRGWREKLGLFAVEGEDLVEAALAAGLEPVELLGRGRTSSGAARARLRPRPPAAVIAVFRAPISRPRPRDSGSRSGGSRDPGNDRHAVRSVSAVMHGALDGSRIPASVGARRGRGLTCPLIASLARSEGCADPTSPGAARCSEVDLPVPLARLRAGAPTTSVCCDERQRAAERLAEVELAEPVTLCSARSEKALPPALVAGM